jgi:ribosomal protein L18
MFSVRVTFARSGKYLEGKIIHHSGRTVVSASTREQCYQDHGLPATDTAAAINLASILARRCLESGILFVHAENDESDESEKSKAFFKQLRA